jgi:tRNA (guanine37-N1)-methyltransferase
LKKDNSYVIFLSPKGVTLKQEVGEELSRKKHLILVCGRYEGIDQRVIDELVDEEISIGNYVLSGGEIPAMVLVDNVSRLIPGVIKNESFNNSESFSDPSSRDKLDFPQYTRPADFRGLKVPEILLSGNHKKIDDWRNTLR